MGFYVLNGVGRHVGRSLRFGNHICLAIDAGRGVTELETAIVVNGSFLNYRLNMIASRDCIRQALEYHDTHAGAKDSALPGGVKGTAVAVWRIDATGLVDVTCPLGHFH